MKAIDQTGKPIPNNNRIGTRQYMAPELLSKEGAIDMRLTDNFSCGVILFSILTYCYPFGRIEKKGSKLRYALERMKLRQYKYHNQCTPSNQCKGIVAQLLEYDHFSRLTSDQLLYSEWFDLDLQKSTDRVFLIQTSSFPSCESSYSYFSCTSKLDPSGSDSLSRSSEKSRITASDSEFEPDLDHFELPNSQPDSTCGTRFYSFSL